MKKKINIMTQKTEKEKKNGRALLGAKMKEGHQRGRENVDNKIMASNLQLSS